MILEICKAKKFIGKEFELKMSFILPPDSMQDVAVNSLAEGAINGCFVMQDENTCVINATATLYLQAVCFRCGNPFTFKYTFNVNEIFSSSPMEDEYQLDNTTLNLISAVTDNFLTQFPSQLLCNKNCKGLCQYCGINLNINNCDCEAKQTEQNSPFAVLKQLK